MQEPPKPDKKAYTAVNDLTRDEGVKRFAGQFRKFGREIKTRMSKKMSLIVLVVIASALALGYFKALRDIAHLRTPEGSAGVDRQEVSELLEQVRRLILLPEGEVPLVATVQDAEALIREQSFYLGVRNGNKLLVYGSARKAIIYDPERDILVNVGPVYFDEQAVSPQVPQEPVNVVSPAPLPQTEGLSIEIRNGSGEPGAARELGDKLESKPDYSVVGITDAARNNYEEVLLIDLVAGSNPEAITKLAAFIGATVITSLPEEETESGAEVLIILGGE